MDTLMTADCITFNDIESRAESSVALAIYARRITEGVVAHTLGYFVLTYLSSKLTDLADKIKTADLEKCSDTQLLELAGLLKQLDERLIKLSSEAKVSGVANYHILRKPLRIIEDRADDFESIIENIYLATNENFHKVVSSAIEELGIGVEERATLLR